MQKLLRDVEGMKLLTRFLARDQRPKLVEVETEVRRLVNVVDRFYSLLGDRNWIYHDDIPVPTAEEIVQLGADEAERALIEFYQTPDSLRMIVRRLGRFPELQERMHLLEVAEADFHAGRYHATVHLLLSVMDGFVNDLDPGERRGLHARDSDELHAWDSVVGHHLGLAHAHASFTRTFKKRSNEPVAELYRNGIVHGMLTNYDNDLVAAKAWNRLFAVADWASSRIRREIPPKPQKSWGEVLRTIARTNEARRALGSWRPSSVVTGEADFEEDEVVAATRQYLDAWQRRNYGVMAGLLSPFFAESSHGQTAGQVREAFNGHTLSDYRLERVDRSAAAVAIVAGPLNVDGAQVPCRLRWIRSGDDGHGVAPNEEGSWRLVTWTPSGMRADPTEATAE